MIGLLNKVAIWWLVYFSDQPICNVNDPDYEPVEHMNSFHKGYRLATWNTLYMFHNLYKKGWALREIDQFLVGDKFTLL